MNKLSSAITGISFLSLVLSFSCSEWNMKSIPPDLTQRIEEYYAAEKKHDWENAYRMRTPAFRQMVGRDRYFEEMAKDTDGWALITYSVRGGKRMENLAFVKIHFVERTPPHGDLPEGALMESSEITVWKKIDGVWLCLAPGMRRHIRLNAELVYEREPVE